MSKLSLPSIVITTKRTLWMYLLIVSLGMTVGLPSANAIELPQDALLLLSEAAAEPCAICAEQKQKKAFAILNRTFIPGTMLKTDAACQLVKKDGSRDPELSLTCFPPAEWKTLLPEGSVPVHLVFRFHTMAQHLVGITEKDFTDRGVADTFQAAAPGTIFEGRLRIIPYAYGDGPAFNYFLQSNTLQVHCIIEEIRIKIPSCGS